MARKLAIGVQDFERLITERYFYVDKTFFIKEWWERADSVTLITPPRRFGKILAINMLESFFSVRNSGKGTLFQGLVIWKEETYRKLQGTYPVICLTFASVKQNTYEKVRQRICQIITDLYQDYRFIRDSGVLSSMDQAYFDRVSPDMQENDATYALYKLSDFVRSLFHAAFKTNPYLERGLMTGITRISKESVFSDLNNLKVISSTSDQYAEAVYLRDYESGSGNYV